VRVQRTLKAVAGRWARLAAAAGVGTIMTLGMSGVALADPPVTGKANGETLAGLVYNKAIQDPNHQLTVAAKIQFTPTGGAKPVLAYCVDLFDPLGDERDTYTETPATASGVKNLDKVNALLDHSLPVKTPDQVAAAAKLTKPAGVTDEEFENAIYTGTQAAIWNSVDPENFELLPFAQVDEDREDFPQIDAAEYKIAEAVYNYLLGKLAKPSLAIDPASANGTVGGKAGPFTVKSEGVGDADLTSAGVLVDADGKPVTKVSNGGKFWVDCKAEGAVDIEGKAGLKRPKVTVFTGSFVLPLNGSAKAKPRAKPVVSRKAAPTAQSSEPLPLQTIITVDVVPANLAAKAKAVCAKASGGLPVTGAPIAATLAAGLLLLATGAGLFMVRRRRVSFTA
jgi:LPXTG-motif cell wall-anchored protein